MKRRGTATRIMVVTPLLSLLGLLACGSRSGHNVDDMVDIGTHSLHIRCTGEGSPVVVIDTGVGDTWERWQAFQAEVARITRACTYDRAGYGSSEPGPLPRDSQRAAEELKQLLDNAGVRGPYLLVGHSLGGLNAQVFGDGHPEQVAGLILLDPPPLPFITGEELPDLYEMLELQATDLRQVAEAMRRSPDAEAKAKLNYLEAVASEQAALIAESESQVAAIESFGDIPLVVIGSGRPNPAFGADAEAFQRFWIEQGRALAAKSTHGEFVLAQESSHYLHENAPNVVLEAIRQMVQQAEE